MTGPGTTAGWTWVAAGSVAVLALTLAAEFVLDRVLSE